MAANYEMLSFLGKFNQMTSFGYNASLNFNCQNGRVNVQISADLGCLDPGLYPFPTASYSNRSRERPSKVRRRNRRAQSTKNADAFNVEILDAELNKHIATSEETHDASSSSRVESDQDQYTLIENLPVHSPEADLPMSVVCHTSSHITSNQTHVTDEETMSKLAQNIMEESAVVQCNLCHNRVVPFSRRAEFLRHICVDHFGEENLINFPEFLPNDVFQQAMTLPI